MSLFKKKTKGRSILALDHYDWFGFDNDRVKSGLKNLGIDYHQINLSEAWGAPEKKDLDSGFLYQAVIYTVCNELELVLADVDLDDPSHLEVYSKWEQIAKNCAGYVVSKINECHITKILVPQGYVLEAAVCRLLAAKLCLPILAIENTLSKEKMLWENISGITVNANLSKNYFFKYAPLISAKKATEYTQRYLSNVQSLKSIEHSTPVGSTMRINDSKKIVLFLGQVYVDSSVLFGINRFANQEKIVEFLCDYCIKNGHTLIVKLHPKEIDGMSMVNKPFDKMTWRKICDSNNYMSKYHGHADVIVDHENKYDTYKLIEQANVCVTINSMSGLEACIIGKEIVTCGQSCYGGLGFTSDAYDYDDLNYYLDKILKCGCVDLAHLREDAMKFFYIYMNLYCVEKTESELVRLLAS